LLEHGEKASSRRNVFLLTAVLGLQVLLQCDSAQQEEEWYEAIHKAITDLVSKDSGLASNNRENHFHLHPLLQHLPYY
jgi:hypothetical protein